MTDGNGNDTYPRILNGSGCLFGQTLARRFDVWRKGLKEELKEDYKARMNKIEAKVDKILWTMVGVLVALATTSVTLWITHLGP